MRAALVKEAEEKRKKSEVSKDSDESEDEAAASGQDLPGPTPPLAQGEHRSLSFRISGFCS